MHTYPTSADPTAVLGRRSGAYIVDTLIAAGIATGLFFATGDVTEITDLSACPNLLPAGRSCVTFNDVVYFSDNRGIAFAVLGWLVYAVVVMWIVQAVSGATLGKALFGVRTVNEEGGPPGFGRQTIRGLLWIFPDGFFNCCGLPVVAAFTAGLSKGHRRVGDMAAKTYVVGSTDTGTPIVLPSSPDPVVAPAPMPSSAFPSAPPQQVGPPVEATPPTRVAPTPPSGPQWDPQRGAYIQYDPARGTWLTYDDAAKEWKPLS